MRSAVREIEPIKSLTRSTDYRFGISAAIQESSIPRLKEFRELTTHRTISLSREAVLWWRVWARLRVAKCGEFQWMLLCLVAPTSYFGYSGRRCAIIRLSLVVLFKLNPFVLATSSISLNTCQSFCQSPGPSFTHRVGQSYAVC